MAAELAASAAELTASEQQAQAARTHRALQTDDVLACVFSRLALRDGCVSVASVCKQWRGAWRRRAKGLYRPVRLGLGPFEFGDHLTPLAAGGVIVPDYNEGCLQLYTAEGEHRWSVGDWNCPTAVALDDEGVSWVVNHDNREVGRHPVNYETMQLRAPSLSEIAFFQIGRPIDLEISGDAVLVLFHTDWGYGEVAVLDRNSGAVRYRFGSSAPPGCVDELRGAMGLAIDGEYCFVADTYNQSVVIFNWRDGTFVRRIGKAGDAPEMHDDEYGEHYWDLVAYDDDRKSAEPGQFHEPYDVAVRNKLLYVSERGGRRIQILRLPDDLSAADPEVLQIIPSPGGVELAGICLDGERLWCVGAPYHAGSPAEDYGHASISIFAPIV